MQAVVKIISWNDIMTDKDKDVFFKEVGRRIAELRREQGLSQAKLAKMLKSSQQIVADYETGKRHVPVWRLVVLAELMGVEADAFLKVSKTASKKRGPAPKIQKQLEMIQRLPKDKQKVVTQMLDMALNSA